MGVLFDPPVEEFLAAAARSHSIVELCGRVGANKDTVNRYARRHGIDLSPVRSPGCIGVPKRDYVPRIDKLSDPADLSHAELIKLCEQRGIEVIQHAVTDDSEHELETPTFDGQGSFKIGVVSDVHLGSRFQQLTFLGAAYDYFEREGIVDVINAGDLVGGSDRMHPGMVHELFVHGGDEQTEYACEVYPKRDGILTHIISGNHDHCVDAETEALTDRGWKHVDDLTGDERFATLDPETMAFAWQTPTGITVNRDYAGVMYHIRNRNYDHLVSPNHDLFVQSGRTGKWRKRKPGLPRAAWYYKVLNAALDWDGTAPASVEIPRSPKCAGFSIDPHVFARLAGWYIAEGTIDGSRVTLSQARTSPHYAEIVELIETLDIAPAECKDSMIRFCSSPLATFLSAHFGDHSSRKHIPGWMKDWSKDLLDEMLGAYLRGDAHRHESGDGWTATTTSDQLIDDLQEVCAKLGYRTRSSLRQSFPVKGTSYIGTARRLYITARATSRLPAETAVEYKGTIWCPEVPHGVWFARRNGTTYWTGNSHLKANGTNVVRNVAKERSDLDYLGKSGAYLTINGVRMYVHHPSGGVAYARSYRLQKQIEQFSPENKPNVLIQGHLHVTCVLEMYRNVFGFIAGCFEAQTPYLVEKGVYPEVGFTVLEVTYDDSGAVRFKKEFVPFYVPLTNDYRI